MSDENRTTADLVLLALVFGGIGFVARAVRYAREHGHEAPFNWVRFVICTMSAALVSVLLGWALDALEVKRELTLAAVGVAGYVGGPLLDVAYDEVLETVKAAFDAVQKRLND